MSLFSRYVRPALVGDIPMQVAKNFPDDVFHISGKLKT